MTEPMRLKDDAEFLRETGVRLDDPALTPTVHDLPSMAERLMANISAVDAALALQSGMGAAWAASAWFKALLVATSLAAGIAIHAAWMVHAPHSEPDPVVTVVPVPMFVQVPVPETEKERAPEPTVQPPKPRPQVIVAHATLSEERPIPDASIPRPKPMSLAEQLRLYESGRTALRARNWEVAEREFLRFMEDAPNGELWPEAGMGLLEALTGQGQWARLQSACTQLLDDGRLAVHQRSILRLRAQALEKLGQCADAERDLMKAVQDSAERDRLLQTLRAACKTPF